jgi:hypothetical protein
MKITKTTSILIMLNFCIPKIPSYVLKETVSRDFRLLLFHKSTAPRPWLTP